LTRIKIALQKLTHDCMEDKTLDDCPLLEALNSD